MNIYIYCTIFSCVNRFVQMFTPRAVLHPTVVYLTATGTGFTQDNSTLRTYQPTRLDLFQTTRAYTRQGILGRNRLIQLHADEVEDDR